MGEFACASLLFFGPLRIKLWQQQEGNSNVTGVIFIFGVMFLFYSLIILLILHFFARVHLVETILELGNQ